MTVLITGDSHLSALSAGYRSMGSLGMQIGEKFDFRPIGIGGALRQKFFESTLDGVSIINPKMPKSLESIPDPVVEYSVAGISGPLHTIRIWRDDWSAFRLFGVDGTAKTAHGVSRQLLKRLIDRDVGQIMKFIIAVKKILPVFVVDAPGPFRSNPLIEKNGTDMVLEINKIYREQVLELLKSESIPVILCAGSWFDSDGFMLEKYKSPAPSDFHHGNEEFGMAMMGRIVEELNR